jgi:hypothetical protein
MHLPLSDLDPDKLFYQANRGDVGPNSKYLLLQLSKLLTEANPEWRNAR